MNVMKHMPYPVKLTIRSMLHLVDRYARKSFSQEGEDILLARYIDAKRTGFFVDIGAHHPSRCSNTYYFYKRGWRGINIDAMPGSMTPFRIVRPRDINIEIAISDKVETIEFHTFKEPLFNSANKELAESRREQFGEKKNSANTHFIQAATLKSILDKYLPKNTEIDFLSVDIEGLDLNALKSNDWSKYRPKYILVEILGESIQSLSQTETYQFLSDMGYEAVSKLVHTVVFREKSMGRIAHF